jgi:uncharacterized protein YdeI (YjbR/CyaY-like superfamily)
MAEVVPNPKNIRSFKSEAEFDSWMRRNHDRATDLWLKIHKKDSGKQSITVKEALDVALCWGWIDGIRKAFDANSYLQRYTPRGPKSIWSQINRDNIARLTKAGRMTPQGLRQVDAAKADGRWDAAYAHIRNTSAAGLPKDLLAAIKANPAASKTFATLNRMNLFSLAFRTNNMKTAAGRAKKIAELTHMLAQGKTIVPQKSKQASTAKIKRGRKTRARH